MTATTETLASTKITGPYGFAGERALVKHRGKHYLISDEFCGGDLEGRCMRPFIYRVPAALVQECIRVLESPDPEDNDFDFLVEKLDACGRADRLTWAWGWKAAQA